MTLHRLLSVVLIFLSFYFFCVQCKCRQWAKLDLGSLLLDNQIFFCLKRNVACICTHLLNHKKRERVSYAMKLISYSIIKKYKITLIIARIQSLFLFRFIFQYMNHNYSLLTVYNLTYHILLILNGYSKRVSERKVTTKQCTTWRNITNAWKFCASYFTLIH
jgi:hypothetical protein